MSPTKEAASTPYYSLFSAGQPDSIKILISDIPDAEQSEFRTSVFCTDDSSGIQRHYWLEAWKNKKNNLWTIDRHESVTIADPHDGAQQNDVHFMPQHAICRDIGFFDALRLCSESESAERKLGHLLLNIPDGHEINLPHYLSVAETANQPVDKETLLVYPAAQGRILVDGTFTSAMYETAEKTKQTSSEDNAPRSKSITLAESVRTQSLSMEPLIKAGISRLEYVRLLQTAFDRSSAVKNTLDDLVTHKFTRQDGNGFFYMTDDMIPFAALGIVIGAIASVVTAGAAFPYVLGVLAGPYLSGCSIRQGIKFVKGDHESSPQRYFSAQKDALNFAIADLPDTGEKKLLVAFSKAAAANHELEKAALVYDLGKKTNTPAKKTRKKGMALIDSAIKAGALGSEESAQLRHSYLDDSFPEPGHFAAKLAVELKVLDQRTRALRTSLTAPTNDQKP